MHRLTTPIWLFAAENTGGGEGGDGGAASGGSGGETPPGDGQSGKDQTFTQADVDRIVADRLKRERETTRAKYADYEDLKKAADAKKSAEDRIAELQRDLEETKRETLKRRVQAAHQISDEDADLFLTGPDEETLTAQARRLTARESERKKKGNHVPGEGTQTRPPADEARQAVRQLFGSGGG